MLSHSLHDMVLGGAAQASSTNSRYIQWAAGTPYIKSNPITGHGFGLGGLIIGLGQIDSYILSLVVETGILGLVFFLGLLVLPVWYGLRNYLSDMSESGALAGALACSFIGFIMNTLVLSQRENHMLIFSLLAVVIVLNYELVRKRAPQPLGDKSVRKTYRPAGSIPPAGAIRAEPPASRDNQGERTQVKRSHLVSGMCCRSTNSPQKAQRSIRFGATDAKLHPRPLARAAEFMSEKNRGGSQ